MQTKRTNSLDILIYAPTPLGGLAEHIHYQAIALSQKNISCLMLSSHDFLNQRSDISYPVKYILLSPSNLKHNFFFKKLKLFFSILLNQWILAFQIIQTQPKLILLESYSEYLSPFWFFPHFLLAKFFKLRYVANLHDPVRNYIVGPLWWHQISMRLAYLPLSYVLIHQKLPSNAMVPERIKVFEVPVGIYDIKMNNFVEPNIIRDTWGVSYEKYVFLSFGFIRDDKNLDLFMKSMVDFPEVFLVILGSIASSQNKPISFYKELAHSLHINDRVYISENFVPDEQVASNFLAADVVLLIYSGSFHSQSGVLNIAAKVQKPVLASSGLSPLKECVEKFSLGVFIQPDSISALKNGITKVLTNEYPKPSWKEYSSYASWDINANIILEILLES